MRRVILFLAFFIGLMMFLLRVRLIEQPSAMPESMMVLGFILVVAYLFGKITARFNLPKITGYMLTGVILGPYIINVISEQSVNNLQLINKIALGLIAVTAGGEFRYSVLQEQFKTIVNVILWQILIVSSGFIVFFLIFGKNFFFLSDANFSVLLGVGLLFGSLAVAKSPATTIAIITETEAKGKLTDFVLGVTVFKDIVVVLVFSLSISIAKPLIQPHEGLHFHYILEVIGELGISILVGIGAGGLILLYLKYIETQTALFLLGFILLVNEISTMFHIELVLVFMVAGFLVQNFSNAGHKLIEAIEEASLPIYVTFFAIAGASLNLPIFLSNFWLAMLIVLLRMVTTFGGTYIGGKLTHSTPEVQKLGWMGFIGQAGLTLGLVTLVGNSFPGAIGNTVSTLIIASVAINQIIGPVLFRYSLIKTGEGKG